MKILIVNISDLNGGAARAAYRLHKALLAEKVDSQMLVQYKHSDDHTVLSMSEGKLSYAWSVVRSGFDALPLKAYKERSKTEFSVSRTPFSGLVERINTINPDILHLHLVVGAMLKLEDIVKIKVPIVWTLHDMWLFTGGCHYTETCERYKELCGNCKVLGSTKEEDLSRKIFMKKEKIFPIIENMNIVGLSKWLHTCAKDAPLLHDKKHIQLPNPIDTEQFKPLEKREARRLWNLPLEKKLVLFGAIGATSDPRKGFFYLKEALLHLERDDVELIIFGSSEPKERLDLGFKQHYMGLLYDEVSLISLYSAVDVMVVPSMEENLSNAIMESLACATPVVAFNIGGNADMIEHQKSGYLVTPYKATDLARGIEFILDAPNYNKLCHNAREKVVKNFENSIVAPQYIKLYQEVLDV